MLDWPPPYTIRRSKRAKRVGIRIIPDKGVELVLPMRMSERQALAFMHENQEWVEKHQHWIAPSVHLQDHERYAYPERLSLQAIELEFPIRYLNLITTSKPKPKLKLEADTLFVYGADEHFKSCLPAMHKFLINLAYRFLNPWLFELSELTQLSYETVTFRKQSTRWGSCSSQKRISLNYKLLFLPRDITRYVMIHELCHLQEMNHSVRFWSLVEGFEPDYRRLKRELRDADKYVPIWL